MNEASCSKKMDMQKAFDALRKMSLNAHDVSIANRSEAPSRSGMHDAPYLSSKPKRIILCPIIHKTSGLSHRGDALIQSTSSLSLEPPNANSSFTECHQQNTEQRTSFIENDEAKKYLPQKPLNLALLWGKLETVRELLNSGADPEERDGFYGNTAIHWAVRANNIEALELFRERGVNLNVTNRLTWTPIHIAAEGCQRKSLLWLLKNGADVESEDSYRQTPLYKAAFKGHISVAKLLLYYGASPNSKDVKLYTPLSEAAVRGHIEMVKLLFEHGADLKNTDSWGRNLLHIVKTFPLLEWLVEHNIDINGKDDWGRTPLHDAVQASNLQNASYLLEKGANIEAQDRNGCTPLYEAAKTGKVEFVRLFLEKGADPESTAKDGSTPAEVASDEMIKNLLLHKKGSGKMN